MNKHQKSKRQCQTSLMLQFQSKSSREITLHQLTTCANSTSKWVKQLINLLSFKRTSTLSTISSNSKSSSLKEATLNLKKRQLQHSLKSPSTKGCKEPQMYSMTTLLTMLLSSSPHSIPTSTKLQPQQPNLLLLPLHNLLKLLFPSKSNIISSLWRHSLRVWWD